VPDQSAGLPQLARRPARMSPEQHFSISLMALAMQRINICIKNKGMKKT
jgi:hypothetical protein